MCAEGNSTLCRKLGVVSLSVLVFGFAIDICVARYSSERCLFGSAHAAALIVFVAVIGYQTDNDRCPIHPKMGLLAI